MSNKQVHDDQHARFEDSSFSPPEKANIYISCIRMWLNAIIMYCICQQARSTSQLQYVPSHDHDFAAEIDAIFALLANSNEVTGLNRISIIFNVS